MFENSIFIREHDDVFCSIKSYKSVFVKNRYNIHEFMEIYEAHKSTHNIFIDSRLIEMIIYGFMFYDNSFFVYNINNGTVWF